jgi:MtrB/PioB family decaheme-associated outer membrane protein
MRNRLTIATAALLLASATLALAQAEQKKTPPPAPAATEDSTSLGTIDFGFRGTSVTGDLARYERYSDLRNGANINLDLGKTTGTYTFGARGRNVGYKDENISAFFGNSRFNVTAFFDQLPLNYGLNGLTKTPWNYAGNGVFTLDSAARAAVEAKQAVGVLCAPGLAAGATCTPATAATALNQVSIFRGLAKGIDLAARRDTLGFGLAVNVVKDVDVDMTFTTTKKSGNQPYGMSFAFNNANELPMPLDNRTNDFGMSVVWGSDHGMIRLAFDRSTFTQNIASVTWDNPVRLTDWNDGQPIDLVTNNGPWDPSAYSNGNGPARGRIAMAPSNSQDVFSATGMAKLPGHSVLNASLAYVRGKQNDAFIPWTINPVIANAATYVYYPGLAQLPRASAQAQMDVLNAVINFTARPAPWVGLSARYRHNDRKDRMPTFDGGATVRFDGVPEPGPYITEPLNATRDSFNVDATFTPIPFTALKLGAGKERYEHSARGFGWLDDATIRASLDTVGNQYVQLRGMVERSRRTGGGFNEEAITGPGGQELSRMYEDAERTRDRATLLVILSPASFLDVTASYALGKDIYDETEARFGLLDNKNTTVNVGVSVTPNDKIAFGANYGQDKFHAFQRSRTANPFSGVPGAYESWTDPNRDWTVDNDEKVNNFDLFVDLIKALPKTDIRLGYTMSDSDNAFVHGGPRVTELLTNKALTPGDTAPCAAGFSSCYEPLPNVTNKWTRMTAEVRYAFTKKIGAGVEYWYEKLDVTDFNTIDMPGQPGVARIDYLGELSTGYGNRPYKGSTFFARLFYNF